MNNPFTKKLFRVTNRNNCSYLIISESIDTALEISMQLKFAKKKENLRVQDFSNTYLNEDRLAKGLNFDQLPNGQFFQEIDVNISTWHTYLPTRIKNRL